MGRTLRVRDVCDALDGTWADADVYVQVPGDGGNYRVVTGVETLEPDDDSGEDVHVISVGEVVTL